MVAPTTKYSCPKVGFDTRNLGQFIEDLKQHVVKVHEWAWIGGESLFNQHAHLGQGDMRWHLLQQVQHLRKFGQFI